MSETTEGEKRCSLLDCERPHLALTYCSLHYKRFKKHGDPTVVKNIMPPIGEIKQYFSDALKVETDDCIEWQYARDYNYGYITYEGKNWKVSRLVMFLKQGEAPIDKPHVLHSCDNPPCFNYRHLRYGSVRDNFNDAISRNRTLKGERHPQAKLTTENVLAIRKDDRNDQAIAEEYGVSRPTIYKIKTKEYWSWLQ